MNHESPMIPLPPPMLALFFSVSFSPMQEDLDLVNVTLRLPNFGFRLKRLCRQARFVWCN